MSKSNDIIRILIDHVRVFQTHTHPVVQVLMRGFSKVLVRDAFSAADRWGLDAMAGGLSRVSGKHRMDEEG